MSLLNQSQEILDTEKVINFKDNEAVMDKVAERLPTEAATLMNSIVHQFNRPAKLTENEEPLINKLVHSLPSEALVLLKNIINYYRKEPIKVNPNEEVNNKAIRAQPILLQRAIKQKRALELIKYAKSEAERLTIYESGVALGLVVGSTTRAEVIEEMKNHSSVVYPADSKEAIFFYDDICTSVFFDERDVISELQFGTGFKGETCRGLKVGDNINKAIELYGKPRMKSSKAALWNYFSIFCVNNRIRCIRIQS